MQNLNSILVRYLGIIGRSDYDSRFHHFLSDVNAHFDDVIDRLSRISSNRNVDLIPLLRELIVILEFKKQIFPSPSEIALLFLLLGFLFHEPEKLTKISLSNLEPSPHLMTYTNKQTTVSPTEAEIDKLKVLLLHSFFQYLLESFECFINLRQFNNFQTGSIQFRESIISIAYLVPHLVQTVPNVFRVPFPLLRDVSKYMNILFGINRSTTEQFKSSFLSPNHLKVTCDALGIPFDDSMVLNAMEYTSISKHYYSQLQNNKNELVAFPFLSSEFSSQGVFQSLVVSSLTDLDGISVSVDSLISPSSIRINSPHASLLFPGNSSSKCTFSIDKLAACLLDQVLWSLEILVPYEISANSQSQTQITSLHDRCLYGTFSIIHFSSSVRGKNERESSVTNVWLQPLLKNDANPTHKVVDALKFSIFYTKMIFIPFITNYAKGISSSMSLVGRFLSGIIFLSQKTSFYTNDLKEKVDSQIISSLFQCVSGIYTSSLLRIDSGIEFVQGIVQAKSIEALKRIVESEFLQYSESKSQTPFLSLFLLVCNLSSSIAVASKMCQSNVDVDYVVSIYGNLIVCALSTDVSNFPSNLTTQLLSRQKEIQNTVLQFLFTSFTLFYSDLTAYTIAIRIGKLVTSTPLSHSLNSGLLLMIQNALMQQNSHHLYSLLNAYNFMDLMSTTPTDALKFPFEDSTPFYFASSSSLELNSNLAYFHGMIKPNGSVALIEKKVNPYDVMQEVLEQLKLVQPSWKEDESRFKFLPVLFALSVSSTNMSLGEQKSIPASTSSQLTMLRQLLVEWSFPVLMSVLRSHAHRVHDVESVDMYFIMSATTLSNFQFTYSKILFQIAKLLSNDSSSSLNDSNASIFSDAHDRVLDLMKDVHTLLSTVLHDVINQQQVISPSTRKLIDSISILVLPSIYTFLDTFALLTLGRVAIKRMKEKVGNSPTIEQLQGLKQTTVGLISKLESCGVMLKTILSARSINTSLPTLYLRSIKSIYESIATPDQLKANILTLMSDNS
jgi:hypothetical protein